MNVFSIMNLLDGIMERRAMRVSFNNDQRGFYCRYSGRSKTFKRNQRRGF